MLWIRQSLAPRFFAPLLLAPLALILLAALFVAPAGAQVGQQPDRNRRPPVMPTGSANANAGANGQQASYPGANEILERAFALAGDLASGVPVFDVDMPSGPPWRPAAILPIVDAVAGVLV